MATTIELLSEEEVQALQRLDILHNQLILLPSIPYMIGMVSIMLVVLAQVLLPAEWKITRAQDIWWIVPILFVSFAVGTGIGWVFLTPRRRRLTAEENAAADGPLVKSARHKLGIIDRAVSDYSGLWYLADEIDGDQASPLSTAVSPTS